MAAKKISTPETFEVLLKEDVILQKFGIGKTTLAKFRNTQGFPCHKLTARVIRYRLSEVEAWITQNLQR